MSPETGNLVRSESPATSDASVSTPRSRAIDESFKKDKSYRRYASNVDRALSLFDSALQEWADYISFLSKLLKALQSHPPSLPIVPNRVVVAKRLAQCLNPALPSGVHQKTLEVYRYVFAMLPREHLSQDISLYLPGIAPTLTFASLSSRPLFLSLIENYLLPLEPTAIRPSLRAILLALLPGLEEERSEEFETTLRIINKFRLLKLGDNGFEGDGTGFFWQTIFLISLTNPGRRPGVLAYLNRYLPKLGSADTRPNTQSSDEKGATDEDGEVDSRAVSKPEPGLLIRCFAAGLTDAQALVQRSFLDLLVTHLSLHSNLLQHEVSQEDLRVLVTAATSVVTRRDMSLNRRLWAWFLGPEGSQGEDESQEARLIGGAFDSSKPTASRYFHQFGLKPLVHAIHHMIAQQASRPAERAKPFRMALSLMDRWEIGTLVVPEIFLPIMQSTKDYKETCESKAQFDEVFRSSSAFFDGVESSLIFSEILGLLQVEKTPGKGRARSLLEDFKLANFILSHYNLKEEEMLLLHLPLVLFAVLQKMQSLVSKIKTSPEASHNALSVLEEATSIARVIQDLLPSRAFTSSSSRRPSVRIPDATLTGVKELTVRHVVTYYKACKESFELPMPPIAPPALAQCLLKDMKTLLNMALESDEGAEYFRDWASIFVSLLSKVAYSDWLRENVAQPLLQTVTRHLETSGNHVPFSKISSIVSVVTALYSTSTPAAYITNDQLLNVIPLLTGKLWTFLSPTSPKYHVEAVRGLWLLHSVTWTNHHVEASICSLMVDHGTRTNHHCTSQEDAERYFVLWNHSHHTNVDYYAPLIMDEVASKEQDPSALRFEYQLALLKRPLFLILDLLQKQTSETASLVKDWLHDLFSIHSVLRILLLQLRDADLREVVPEDAPSNSIELEGANQLRYLLQSLFHVMEAFGSAGWSVLSTYTISGVNLTSPIKEPVEAQSMQAFLAELCLKLFVRTTLPQVQSSREIQRLQQVILDVLQQQLLSPSAELLSPFEFDTFLIEELSSATDRHDESLQPPLIKTLLVALKGRISRESAQLATSLASSSRRKISLESAKSMSRLSVTSGEKPDKRPSTAQPPTHLMPCLLKGIKLSTSQPAIQKWLTLMTDCLPFYAGSIYQVILTLVAVICQRATATYDELRAVFTNRSGVACDKSEQVTIILLNGLENCLAIAHERLVLDEANAPVLKTPDTSQSFFGNMVSGVFSSDASQTRSATANNRLTVILCFQDAVRLCFAIWSWNSSNRIGEAEQDSDSLASFHYTSLRMRNRSRRILENLFQAEALECLETLIELWHKSIEDNDSNQTKMVLSLLHTLDHSRPKFTIPAVFNAIYTRTNPIVIEHNRKSSMSTHLAEAELVAFLVAYARSLDEDVLDEIWADCTTFLKDVLANPFPHRQILSRLMEFTVILGDKMQHTSFGDDKRAKKDLGDLLTRLLTAAFTSKPLGSTAEPSTSHRLDESSTNSLGSDDIVSILATITPGLAVTLGDNDRIGSAMMNISANIISPILHSRLFPQNVHRKFLELLLQMGKIPAANRYFKKDVSDAFNDPRFFSMKLDLVQSHWLRILSSWTLLEKERLPELLQRLPQPTAAGMLFGVGASAARLEADRKVQLNLRRVALLVLTAEEDHFSSDIASIHQKLEDLLGATSVSSPSSVTRAEIFMLLRALVLKTSTIHLAPFWPLVNDELYNALSSLSPTLDEQSRNAETYNSYSQLQACKLLETLLLTSPDDFQAQAWLFITDTIDAVYPWQSSGGESTALADHISRVFDRSGNDDSGRSYNERKAGVGEGEITQGLMTATTIAEPYENTPGSESMRVGFLSSPLTREVPKDAIVEQVLQPFFEQLSIRTFEGTYSMRPVDVQGCKDDLLADLFNEFTMAG